MPDGMIVLDPTADALPEPVHLAPRLDTLRGKVGGIIDNGKRNAGPLLSKLAALLKQSGVKDIRIIHKNHASKPIEATDLDVLAGDVDFILVGVGD